MKTCPLCFALYGPDDTFCTKDGARLVESSVPGEKGFIGSLLENRYRILSLLGDGGMSKVYLALHETIQRKVAVKVLRQEMMSEEHASERFQLEARAACAVGSPHIVEVMDLGRLPDGRLFYVMEILEGKSLEDAIKEAAPLPPALVGEIAMQISEGLHAVHQRGIIHRDLKPSNIFLTRFKRQLLVKILDFGIAKVHTFDSSQAKATLTQKGVVFGTPYYISPEQAQGFKVDQRTDIYSFGVILYEMVTGKVPFVGESLMKIMIHHVTTPPVPPVLAAPESVSALIFNDIILQALAKEPEERLGSMDEVIGRLEDILASLAPGEEVSLAGQVGLAGPVMTPLPGAITAPDIPSAALARGMSSLGDAVDTAKTLLSLYWLRGRGLFVVLGIFLAFATMAGFLLLRAEEEPAQAIVLLGADGGEATLEPQAMIILADGGYGPADIAPTPDVTPLPQRIEVALASEPKGARVYHEGALLGQTPLRVRLPKEEVRLEFRLKGWRTVSRSYNLERDQDIRVALDRQSKPSKPKGTAKTPQKKGFGFFDEQ